MTKNSRSFLPSSTLSFLSIATDGRCKDEHNRIVLYWISLLRAGGYTRINANHVDEVGLDRSLPLSKNRKQYDISYVDEHGEVILIEIMRSYFSVLGNTGMPHIFPSEKKKEEI
jgi:hypothetical protein